MVEIIPTIIAQSIDEVRAKIKLIEPYVKLAQLDIMDGRFVKTRTWNKPEELRELQTPLSLEADLMVMHPEEEIIPWLESPVRRIFVQYEAFEDPYVGIQIVRQKLRAKMKEFGLTINPETPVELLLPFVQTCDRILLRGGTPGRYGQPFQEPVIHKVSVLKQRFHGIIEIDGGVKVGIAKRLCKAGVGALAVGSAIFNAPGTSIEEAIERLRRDCE